MKSFVYVDPEFPPPPYTWLIFNVVGGKTVRDAFAVLLRPCASRTEIGSDFAPTLVLFATVAVNENVPLLLSMKACAAEPPIANRSPVTVMPVLAGLVPGVTVTVIVLVAPGRTLPGFVEATPVGGVEVATVRTKSADAAEKKPFESIS